MPITALNVEHLAAAIEQSLADGQAPLGCKLRTEQQIADRLGISRWRLRDAMNLLMERGRISRQRGSGTFLRSQSTPSQAVGDAALPAIDVVDLIEGNTRPQAAQPRQTAADQLRIGLLCDLNSDSHTTRQIQACLIRQFNMQGWQLNIQSSTHRHIKLLSAQEIARQLPDEPCDGYVAQGEAADAFFAALQAKGFASSPSPPVVFYGPRLNPAIEAPFISLSDNGILPYAFELFTQAGLTRIGIVRFRRNRHEMPLERYDRLAEQYESMLRRHGLSYHALEYTQSDTCGSVVDAMKAMLRLLKRDPRPEAVFVSDDHLLPGVTEALELANLVPGRDIAVITIGHQGRPLPGPHRWSHFQASPEAVAQQCIDSLTRMIQNPGYIAPSVGLRSIWKAGDTHLLSK